MGHYSYPLNDDRELRFDRLMAELKAATKAEVLDAAMIHLEESIEAHRDFNAQHPDYDHRCAKQFGTSVIKPGLRTHVELRRP